MRFFVDTDQPNGGGNFRKDLLWLVAGSFLALFLIHTQSEARPAEVEQIRSKTLAGLWYRLENHELTLEFSNENPSVVERAHFRGTDHELSIDSPFLSDSVNGQLVRAATPTHYEEPKATGEPGVLRTVSYADAGLVDDLVVHKETLLQADGAQMEVRYRVTNDTPQTQNVAYSISLNCAPQTQGDVPLYHLPIGDQVARFTAAGTGVSNDHEGLEIGEPWFCVQGAREDLSVFFVSDRSLVSWELGAAGKRERPVRAVLREARLKPGDSFEGVYWIAVAKGLGLPTRATSRFLAGAGWNLGASGTSYRLETRFLGMPREVKKFRIFSAVQGEGSSSALVPVYTRRSRLSPTELVATPLPGSYGEGTHRLEQSIYSSSENVGYWKLDLATPGRVLTASLPQMFRPTSEAPERLADRDAPSLDEELPPEQVDADDLAGLNWPGTADEGQNLNPVEESVWVSTALP